MKKSEKKKKPLWVYLCIDIGTLLLFVLVHYLLLMHEKPLRTPLGQLVNVDGNQISVYTEGSGNETLVFLSGSETPAPILDFKSLYTLLSDEYQIVVVERFGYGFSDTVDKPRDIDTVLSETRAALEAADIEGPFILCPHSLSGLESLYWAQQYPDEVKAIIGLDMAVPEMFDNFKNNSVLNTLNSINTKVGLIRFLPLLRDMDCVKHGTLSEKEKDIVHALLYKNFYNKTVINEFKYFKDNAKTVDAGEVPQVPMLLFVSSDKNKTDWPSYIQNYTADVKDAEIIHLDCPHYIHDYEYVRISEEIKAYLQ